MKAVIAVVLVLMLGMLGASCARESSPGDGRAQAASDFVELLAAGDYAGAASQFDETMSQAMPPSKLGEAWTALTQQVGAFKAQAGVRTQKEQGFDVAYVRCQFERGAVDVKVVFGADGRVSGLWFTPAAQ